MTNEEIFSKIDHTLLSQSATNNQIDKLCGEAIKYKTASVCIPPSYVSYARKSYNDLNICTVIGFPNGYSTAFMKKFEAENALINGANEIDMVININELKNKNFKYVFDEIKSIKKICTKYRILKVIIETSFLTNNEKIEMCKIITKSGADYIKTSTGFSDNGANLEDVELFKKNIGKKVQIKASGGISSLNELKQFINAGCARIGTSKGIQLVIGKGK